MRRILLTGASGFIGRQLLGRLTASGASVLALGRKPLVRTGTGLETVVVDSLEPARLLEALKGRRVDAVVHLAAAGVHPGDRDTERLVEVNGRWPSALASVARELGARAFVMTGSNAEYAQIERDQLDEGAPLETLRLYGTTKAAGALLAVAAGASIGLPTVNLRLFNVFGPGEAPHRLLPSLLESLGKNQPVRLSEGLQERDFLHVDDVCTAIMAALEGSMNEALPTGHYNVCSGQGTSVRQFALSVASACGADPSLLRFGAIPMRPDDLPRVVGSPHAFARHTGWKPAETLERSIAKAVCEMNQVTVRA